jgi:hypothetical protein
MAKGLIAACVLALAATVRAWRAARPRRAARLRRNSGGARAQLQKPRAAGARGWCSGARRAPRGAWDGARAARGATHAPRPTAGGVRRAGRGRGASGGAAAGVLPSVARACRR